MVVAGALAIPLLGVAFTIFLMLFILIPVVALKVNLVTTVEFENEYNNAQLGLLVFMSSTETVNGKEQTVSETIANHIALNDPSDISFLNSKLSKMFTCYKLSDEKETLLQSSCEPKKSTAKTVVALPYGRYTSIISLVID